MQGGFFLHSKPPLWHTQRNTIQEMVNPVKQRVKMSLLIFQTVYSRHWATEHLKIKKCGREPQRSVGLFHLFYFLYWWQFILKKNVWREIKACCYLTKSKKRVSFTNPESLTLNDKTKNLYFLLGIQSKLFLTQWVFFIEKPFSSFTSNC